MSQVSKYVSDAERQAAYRRRRAQSEATKAREAGLVPLPAISSMPGTARWRQALDYALNHVATVRDEMQVYHDDRSERWQESDRAAGFLDLIDQIEQIIDQLDQVKYDL